MQQFLKPANDKLKVRRPDTGEYLPAAGASVELNTYWRRRLRDGDVVKASAPRQTAAKTKGE